LTPRGQLTNSILDRVAGLGDAVMEIDRLDQPTIAGVSSAVNERRQSSIPLYE
jgi:hypothetical protein